MDKIRRTDDRASYFREWEKTYITKHGINRSTLHTHILRFQIFQLLGDKCASCGITDKRVLQIDHINGGGMAEARKNGMRGNKLYKHIIDTEGKGFQVLCANCNWIKRYEKNEVPYYGG